MSQPRLVDDRRFPRIREGQIVWTQGHEFIATNVRYIPDHTPNPSETCEILRYIGVCTEHPANDSIRHTGFNGGSYGYKVNKEQTGVLEE